MSIQKAQCRFSQKVENDHTEMVLYGIIGDYWDDLDVVNVSTAIASVSTPSLTVRVHSDGGNVLEGIAIYNAFREYKGKLTFQVDSFAASMASYIIMAGSVSMYENAYILVHNPWAYISGDAEALQSASMDLKKFTETMIDAYERKTKLSRDKIAELMNAETLLNAKEAKELGFCDTIIGGSSATSAVAVMAKAMAKANKPQDKQEKREMTITIESLRAEHPEIVAKITQEGREQETARIKDVLAQALIPGHEDVIKAMVADGKSTGADAAKAILAAEAAQRKTAAEALGQSVAAIPAVPTIPTPPKEPDTEPTDEAGAKARWDKDASIREEFGSFDTYKAYIANTKHVKVWKGGSK